MKKQIKCKCGESVSLKFRDSMTFIHPNNKRRHVWACCECGQEYYIDANKPINLKNYEV